MRGAGGPPAVLAAAAASCAEMLAWLLSSGLAVTPRRAARARAHTRLQRQPRARPWPALLPVPPELAAELAAESSQRAAAEDGLSYIDSLMQAMLGTAWKYLTGADLLPTDPQDVLSAR